jgi:hypothetical protein
VQIEILGHPGLITDLYRFVGFTVTGILKGLLSRRSLSEGKQSHYAKTDNPLIHTNPFLFL